MQTNAIRFERGFQVWRYTVGHRQLLLRSTKTNVLAGKIVYLKTRIDILFKNVSAFHLTTNLESLEIWEASEVEKQSLTLAPTTKEHKVYVVRQPNFVGYVIAGLFVWHEDELEYFDPSHYAESMMDVSKS